MEISTVSSNLYHLTSQQTKQQFERKESETNMMDIIGQKQQNEVIIDHLKNNEENSKQDFDVKNFVEMIENINNSILKPPTELKLSIHEKTKRINVKIINAETKEVIKEIPPEKMLDMVAKMWELAGLFVDERT